MYILEIKEYRKGRNEPVKIGGTGKANKAIRTEQALRSVEDEFMNISFKAGRSDAQREERRTKR